MTIATISNKSVLTVSKGALKTKMLEYFRRVEKTGKEIIVTDRHIPVLKVVPIRTPKKPSEVFGKFMKRVKYHGDITEPTTSEWEEV